MHTRAGEFGGRTRTFTVSAVFPFLVVVIDELAFLTAYQPERDLRKRAEAAIATLTSQGRSVGVCVVGALQDPRKDVINLRNLFPTRIAMRLDESDQVDMVLGDGTRDRGANVHTLGKGRKERRTPLVPSTIRVLRAWLRERGGAPADPLFPTSTGRCLSRDAVERRLAHHVALAGTSCPSITAKRVTMHTLRHTAAMRQFARGKRRHGDRAVARPRAARDHEHLPARRHEPQAASDRPGHPACGEARSLSAAGPAHRVPGSTLIMPTTSWLSPR